jgi:outer membrane protein assembly factor BamB
VVADELVYVGGGLDGHNFYAVDRQTGQERWKFETEGGVPQWPIISEGLVYFGSNDHNFYALDSQTGQELWRFKMVAGAGSMRPAIAGGVVYFGSYNFYAVK